MKEPTPKVLLLRTAPTWAGCALVWIGLALQSGTLFLIAASAMVLLLGSALVVGRRRGAEGEKQEADPEAVRRIILHSWLTSAVAPLIAVVLLAYGGVSTANLLVVAGLALLVVGGFEGRRLLARSPGERAV